jgi:homoaconitate hydratase family protein
MMEAGIDKVWDKEKIVILFDHFTPAPNERYAGIHKMIREFVRTFEIKHFYGENAGICHQAMAELGFAAPGRLIVGADSHTTTYGAFGCASTGLGFTEIAYIFFKGELWFKVPETIRFDIFGDPGKYVMGKDIILHIAGLHSSEAAQYKSVEFCGSAAKNLPVSCRMTMANMSVEIGAKFGFFDYDDKTAEFLNGRVKGDFEPMPADHNAAYESEYKIDINNLSPKVAVPPNIDNVVSVSELEDVTIDQAYLGSCTNGRLDDLRAAAQILKGKKISENVRLIVVPASYEVYKDAMNEGLLEVIIDAGGLINHPSCGACMGSHSGILASGEVCVSTTNRNFVGRMGSPESKVYLANPYVVAASAVAGRIVHPDDV